MLFSLMNLLSSLDSIFVRVDSFTHSNEGTNIPYVDTLLYLGLGFCDRLFKRALTRQGKSIYENITKTKLSKSNNLDKNRTLSLLSRLYLVIQEPLLACTRGYNRKLLQRQIKIGKQSNQGCSQTCRKRKDYTTHNALAERRLCYNG